jgi:N-methylhydantoinase A/oxoprolinase/acetone carboxylase beta subunit
MSQKLRLKVIACGVFERELQAVARACPNVLDVELLSAGLHEAPDRLRLDAQEAIDRASRSGGWDAVCLAYGLCGRGTAGLIARDVPLVLPRVHDCVSLFLGSARAYREQFARHPGTFYFTVGWYEKKAHPDRRRAESARRFDPSAHPQFAEFAAKYGEENARYIVEFLESWRRNYRRAALIDHGFTTDKHERATQAMAEAAGWEYVKLRGSLQLLEGLAAGRWDDGQFLVVPPGHRVSVSNDERIFSAVPCVSEAGPQDGERRAAGHAPDVSTFVYAGEPRPAPSGPDVALGIDAGGTYTDAVLYALAPGRLLGKAKSLTTHGELARGIEESLAKLDASLFARISHVCLSSTLATNAIVEGMGQSVGLVLMPYHPETARRIRTPLVRCIDARMNIQGEPEEPVSAEQVLCAGEAMRAEGAAAFAVSGYASVRNPEHELQVKDLLAGRFGLPVVCGHELSQQLDFVARAHTAVLNARLVPLVQELLGSVELVLARRGIRAPLFVVRGDGSVMRKEVAHERAIESILSGPAASALGGQLLSGRNEALVVDMGGTTTDVALLTGGRPALSLHGALVGQWRTSVAAADVQTCGLGGDSVVALDGRGRVRVGPQRVIPLSFLAWQWPAVRRELEALDARKELANDAGPEACEFLVVVRRPPAGSLEGQEERIVSLLADGPRSRLELSRACGCLAPQLLRIGRLVDAGIVRRSALTPTDALHVLGRYVAHDVEAARLGCRFLGRFLGQSEGDVARLVVSEVQRRLSLAVMQREAAGDGRNGRRGRLAVDGQLLDAVAGSQDAKTGFRLRWEQLRPVVGVGAPVQEFLPAACAALGTRPIIPAHAEVASAVGAAVAQVVTAARVHVRPGELGGFVMHAPDKRAAFAALEEAEEAAREHVVDLLRRRARSFGTSERQVRVEVNRRRARLQDGSMQLVEVEVEGLLAGPPGAAGE